MAIKINKMDGDKPVWEYFDEDNEDDEKKASKIEEHTVWHEIGHLIGFIIARRLNGDFGQVLEICLTNKGGNPMIKVETELYNPQREFAKAKIEYGKGLFTYQPEDELRLRENLRNSHKFLIYSVYILAGGLFNIYYFTTTPTNNDFNNCFKDEEEDIRENSFEARAGNDWTKLRSLISLQGWDESVFFEFRKELFHIMNDTSLFEYSRGLIEEINDKFNGHVILEDEIESLIQRVISILNKNSAIELRLSKLIDETNNKFN